MSDTLEAAAAAAATAAGAGSTGPARTGRGAAEEGGEDMTQRLSVAKECKSIQEVGCTMLCACCVCCAHVMCVVGVGARRRTGLGFEVCCAL